MSLPAYCRIEAEARARHVTVLGGFPPAHEADLPPGCATLLLLGPDEPHFWPAFTHSPEYRDGRAHAMDRWSARVIGDRAAECGAVALFPFGGPPHLPFVDWALQSGRCHASPVQLLVHDRAGLFVSFRGARALPERIELPVPPPGPCDSCAEKPCLSACPVEALTDRSYDVPTCRGFLATEAGQDCMTRCCAVRRACPASDTAGRVPAQSAYRMGSVAQIG